jgi:hypothetical protein
VIWQYFRFRQAWDDAQTESQRIQIQDAMPGFYYAHRLRQDRETDLPAIVEARLLAGQDDQTIAKSIATLPEAIDCYEQLFFHVRDRLEHGSSQVPVDETCRMGMSFQETGFLSWRSDSCSPPLGGICATT